MLSDGEIANQATLRPITEIADQKLGIPADALVPFGHDKAKVDLGFIRSIADRPTGKLVLVTAMLGGLLTSWVLLGL